ncbi:MAG: hypothetical protein KDG49_21520 [Geminicoccaceae bacterium]|nr:hypothetical protein [Geminicoccaceae bacterium]
MSDERDHCPRCRAVLNANLSELTDDGPADAGTIGVCGVCGELLMFCDPGLRALTEAERIALMAHPRAGPAVLDFLERLIRQKRRP